MGTPTIRPSQRRARHNVQRPLASAPAMSSPYVQSSFDRWLVRAGYVAQVGVLLATVAGYYYTVIPLYQKAALDEQLARREVELKVAQRSVITARRETYEQQRQTLMEGLARRASYDCSDVKVAISQPGLDESRELRRTRLLSVDFDTDTCLAKSLESAKADKVLNETDAAYLREGLQALGRTIHAKRVAAKARILELPKLATRSPSVLDPPSDIMARHYSWEDSVDDTLQRPRASRQEQRLKYAIGFTQERIARDVRLEASRQILDGLRRFDWPVWEDAELSPNK
jgi:hypothetical protein